MKIALIGNTCNNNFALLRYLRDLGHEADLYLYSNEGFSDNNPIHNPEWDTWNFKNWERYIYRLTIPNGLESIIGAPNKFKLPPRLDLIKKLFSKYEFCIGSGITPSVFWRMGRRLDIFYPYSTGIEWVNESENSIKLRKLNYEWPFRYFVYNTQILGIKKSKHVIISSQGITSETLKNKNINYKTLHVPQYYNNDVVPEYPPTDYLSKIISKIECSEFNVFSFMRQLWIFRPNKYSLKTWDTLNKRNNWLINGFRNFLNNSMVNNAYLFLSNWGPDVSESIELVKRLKLENFVVWMPLLPRREISYLLTRTADLGVGEFVCSSGEPWGSTGWECLATGTPFLESVNYTADEFYKKFGYNLPPFMLNVQKAEDVEAHMINCYKNKAEWRERGISNKQWFDENNGINLAKRWIDLLQTNK